MPPVQRLRVLLLCLLLGPALAAGEPSSQSEGLRVERSPMRLRASGTTYDGVPHTSTDPAALETIRKDRYWVEARSGDTIFFPAHLLTSYTEGLGAYRNGGDTWRSFPMFALAISAGWYTPPPAEKHFPDNIHGVTVAAGRVWMGTAGLGIVARDLGDGTWSRYDVKAGVLPGVHATVFYADDEFLFASSVGPTGGWKERLPDVREGDLGPALEVYSLRRDAWLRVRGIPRENVLTFGWTTSTMVSIMCDTRHYARRAFLPLELCTRPAYVEAAPEIGGYVLGRESPEPGAPLRYTIRKDQLETAFASLQE